MVGGVHYAKASPTSSYTSYDCRRQTDQQGEASFGSPQEVHLHKLEVNEQIAI